jgi:hypothetical protein
VLVGNTKGIRPPSTSDDAESSILLQKLFTCVTVRDTSPFYQQCSYKGIEDDVAVCRRANLGAKDSTFRLEIYNSTLHNDDQRLDCSVGGELIFAGDVRELAGGVSACSNAMLG